VQKLKNQTKNCPNPLNQRSQCPPHICTASEVRFAPTLTGDRNEGTHNFRGGDLVKVRADLKDTNSHWDTQNLLKPFRILRNESFQKIWVLKVFLKTSNSHSGRRFAHPLIISTELPRCGYGYFLERHINNSISRWDWKNLWLFPLCFLLYTQ